MDQIASVMNEIGTSRQGCEYDMEFDTRHAVENLNGTWRNVLFMHTAYKILDDIEGFYANNEITINETLRPKTREVFGSVLNLLNPPKAAIDLSLTSLQRGVGLPREEYFETDGKLRVTKSRDAAIEDIKTIYLNNQRYIQRYEELVTAIDKS